MCVEGVTSGHHYTFDWSFVDQVHDEIQETQIRRGTAGCKQRQQQQQLQPAAASSPANCANMVAVILALG